MTPDLTSRVLEAASLVAGLLLSASLALVALRLALGPTLPDRALALDLLGFIAVGFVALAVLRMGADELFDPAMALALMAFLATLALARLSYRRPRTGEGGSEGSTRRSPEPTGSSAQKQTGGARAGGR
jgi:multicomponent Na+:H+ antiporter subunit F